MGVVINVPYVRSSPKAKVIWAEDTVIELFETYLTVSINGIEEVPKDEDDQLLGVKEQKKQGTCTFLKSQINMVEYAWCKECECYDFSIFGNGVSVGYNCSNKTEARGYYEKLHDWLTK